MSVTKQSNSRSNILITDDKVIQERLDQSLRKLSNDVLPPQPYLVKAPTDKPWIPGARQLPKWYAGTPFSKDEEQLQYLSFIPYYREYLGEEIIIVSEGGWSDDKGNKLQDGIQSVQQQEQDKPRPTSELGGGQRKKITLSAYKSKVRGGSEEVTSDMERAQASIRKADDGLRQRQQEIKKPQVNGIGKEVVVEQKKRPRDETTSSARSNAERREKSPRPEKKARPSPPRAQKHVPKPLQKSRTPPPSDTSFPTLESPTLPPTLDPGDAMFLPPLESPTLPPDLEKLLARKLEPVKPMPNGGLDNKRPDSVASNHTNRDSDLSPAPKVRVRNADSPLVNPQSSRSTPKVTPDKKSEVSLARKVHADASKAKGPVSSTAPEKVKLFPGLSRAENIREKEPERVAPRLKLMVKLKYGRQNRKRVEQLLRLQPRAPKKAPATTLSASAGMSAARRDVSDRTEKESSPHPEKRRKFEEGELSTSSSRKAPSSLNLNDKPRTPLAAPFPSPGMQSGLPRSTFSTPKKELKPPAMQRVQSSDTPAEVKTPSGGSRVSTPPAVLPQIGAGTRPSPTSTPMTRSVSSDPVETRRAWRGRYQKFHDLGRKLKHQAQTIRNEKRPSQDSSNGKLHATLVTEALLCFILAIYCLDRGSAPGHPDNGWRSTLPFWEMARGFTKPYSDLYSFTLHIGVLVRNMVHRNDVERLARDPLPSESSTAPTPGSDGTAKIPSEEEKYRRQYIGFKSDLVDNFRQLSNLTVDAGRRLGPDRLERKYPSTWSKRRVLSDPENDKSLQPDGSLAGDYPFPVNMLTTPVEIARLGRRFLKEWCRMENVDWSPKFEL